MRKLQDGHIMKVLGIDPGSTHMGWGFIVTKDVDVIWAYQSGVLGGRTSDHLIARLSRLAAGLKLLMERLEPDVVAIEKPFVGANRRTAFALGHAQGLALVAAYDAGARIVEYTPTQIKRAATGHGGAEKLSVARGVAAILGVPDHDFPFDEADALAAAICYIKSLHEAAVLSRVDRP